MSKFSLNKIIITLQGNHINIYVNHGKATRRIEKDEKKIEFKKKKK